MPARRVALERREAVEHLVGAVAGLAAPPRLAAQARPRHAQARVVARHRPVGAERQQRARAQQVAGAERAGVALRARAPGSTGPGGRPACSPCGSAASTRPRPPRAKRAIVSSGAVSMCSIRCMHARRGARRAVRVQRLADRPVADRVRRDANPAAANRATSSAKRAGSGQNGRVPPPLVSGSSSHAVPDSTTPSMKNFATPPRQRRPAASRIGSCSSTSSSVISGGWCSVMSSRIVSRSSPPAAGRRRAAAAIPSITCTPVTPSACWRAKVCGSCRGAPARSPPASPP